MLTPPKFSYATFMYQTRLRGQWIVLLATRLVLLLQAHMIATVLRAKRISSPSSFNSSGAGGSRKEG